MDGASALIDNIVAQIKLVAKRTVISLFGHDPLLALKLRRLASSNVVTILNLHRVDDRHESAYEAITPVLFDDLIGWLKQHFSIVTFAELNRTSRNKPLLILSFDDGYKDFIEIVVPILERHSIRANENVIPGCVERGLPPMNVHVQDFIGQAPAALLREISLFGLPRGVDPDNRALSCRRVSAAFKSRPIVEQKIIFAELEKQFARFDGFRPTPLMSIGDIRQLVLTHEIGTHSFEHATMAVESDEYVAADAVRCREWHTRKLGIAPEIYAFPNGKAGLGHSDIVRRAGYKHILLAGERFSASGTHVHPRFTMRGASAPELRYRAAGAMAAIRPTCIV